MKRIFFILSLSLTVFFNNAVAQEFSVKGIVLDESNLPLAYVNVLLKSNSNNETILGSSTNDDGVFTINNVIAGNYTLTASFLGFEVFTKSLNIDKDIILENIVLKVSTESLTEVEVIAKKPTLKREVDRLVFNVANSSLSEGNMMEVIRSTPGVLVLDNSISIKNGTPTIYINDRKVNLSTSELAMLLESSPANTIKSVEVITNPPAKYDAESESVLNIIMSKNLITGYRGSVFNNFTQGVFPRYNTGITNFFKNDKISLFANYSFTQNKERRKSNEEINFLDNSNNVDEIWLSNFHRVTQFKTHNINFNLDYYINDKNTISLSSNILLLPHFRYLTNSTTNIFDSQLNPDFNFTSQNLSLDDKHNLGFDLDYVMLFNNESKLSFNAHTTFYDYLRDQNVNSIYSNDITTAFKTASNQDTEIYSGQIDYDLSIDESSSFSSGIKASNIKTNSAIKRYDIVSDVEVLNTNLSDAFSYNEDIFAAYISYDKNWDKWSLSTGLRLEQTEIKGISLMSSVVNNQDYLKLFPTFNLSHQASKKVNLYTNYKRSIIRPDFQSLNPFQFFLNDNTIVTGNPNLQPSFVDHVVLGTSINNTFTIETYYKYSDASFVELSFQDNENNLLVYTPTNLGNTTEYGFDFSLYFSPIKNWQIYFVTSFYNIQDEAVFSNEALRLDTWSNYSIFSNDLSLLKDRSLSANFTLVYVGKNQQGFQNVATRIATDLSITKTIFKKKGTLSLHASDLFNDQDFTIDTNYLNQRNSRFMNADNRYIKIGFSYKFGNTTLETNAREKDNEERNRIKERD